MAEPRGCRSEGRGAGLAWGYFELFLPLESGGQGVIQAREWESPGQSGEASSS